MNRKNSFLLERCWTSEGRDLTTLCKILYRCQGMRYDAVSDQITYSMVGIGCFHLLGHMITYTWPVSSDVRCNAYRFGIDVRICRHAEAHCCPGRSVEGLTLFLSVSERHISSPNSIGCDWIHTWSLS